MTAASLTSTGVVISFVDDGGVERGGRLADSWHTAFEDVAPVRRFPSYKGQSSFQGLWWLATTGRHVGFESWLERDNLMLLDFDPLVIAVASQPFWLSFTAGRVRRHCPDYFVRLIDGTGVVVDVRAEDRIEPKDADVFAATERACEDVGWRYRRVGAIDPVLVANLRWLAGYRHPRCLDARIADRLRRVFADGCRLTVGADSVGDRVAVLPSLFHLMWTGVLDADLRAAPLSADSVVTAMAGPG